LPGFPTPEERKFQMKVRDLIVKLMAVDPELTVVIPIDGSGDFVPVQRVGVDSVAIIDGDISLAYAKEPGAVEVLRLFYADLDGQRKV